MDMKKAVTCLLVLAALALAWAPAARAAQGADRCLILQPSGGPDIRVETNSFWGGLQGNISWTVGGTSYAFTVSGAGEAITQGDDVTCKMHLNGSSALDGGGITLLNANITVTGKRVSSASINFTDVKYSISVVDFSGKGADQEYNGSGPIVGCN